MHPTPRNADCFVLEAWRVSWMVRADCATVSKAGECCVDWPSNPGHRSHKLRQWEKETEFVVNRTGRRHASKGSQLPTKHEIPSVVMNEQVRRRQQQRRSFTRVFGRYQSNTQPTFSPITARERGFSQFNRKRLFLFD